jgi:hypothetical protein
MSYLILDPSRRNPALASKCALAVMAKAPRPGKVKTRLSPPLTMEQAAALNICFAVSAAPSKRLSHDEQSAAGAPDTALRLFVGSSRITSSELPGIRQQCAN